MKKSYSATIVIAAALSTVLLIPVAGSAQTQVAPKPDEKAQGDDKVQAAEKAEVARARQIAQRFEANARVFTVFDRQGKALTRVGDRAMYNAFMVSPDRTRLAVITFDLENETHDLWVLDLATGNSTRITSNKTGDEERTQSPVWSPDGSQVAYVALRDGYWRLYRKASNGAGTEELLYQHAGGAMMLSGWSPDGRYLSFSNDLRDLSGGVLYALPLNGSGLRIPIEIFRSASQVGGGKVSPDGRFLSYVSNQSGRNEVYVRRFSPSAQAGATTAPEPWRVSDQGGVGGLWRQDGKEMYYLAPDLALMVVDVSSAPTLEFGKPKLLFRLPEGGSGGLGGLGTNGISLDGERVIIAVNPSPTRQQITMFDRRGNALSNVGEPGRYGNLSVSPDGTRVAAARTDPQTGNQDIWTFDVASGKGSPITNDVSLDSAPIWSPDGRYVAYVSTRGSFRSIYRKAWNGAGVEEQLFQYTPGASMVLTDWSADGKFLTFHDGCSGVLHVVPLGAVPGGLEQKAIEWLRDEYSVAQARISPDSRFLAYLSDEIKPEVYEVYVRPFDASNPEAGVGTATPVRVTTGGARGMIFWRQDGKELYYLTPEWEVMIVDVTTTPAFQAGTPRLLFKLSGRVVGDSQQWKNVSGDGQRFVFSVTVPANVSAR